MKILLIKALDGSLKPADDEAKEALKKWKANDILRCDIKRPRNILHHRKYFSLLGIVVDNIEKYDNVDDLLFEIKLRMGYCTRVIIDDTVCYKPKSISFPSMDQDTFNKFYSKTIDIILKHFMNVDRQELETAVLGYC